MSERFRASMNWLHTWAGLLAGAILFAAFWMGTLSVFDQEVDRWTMPETRRPAPTSVSLDAIVRTVETGRDLTGLARWGFMHPTDRSPTIEVFFNGEGDLASLQIDPTTGATLVAEERTYGGSGFFFPFHFTLLMPQRWLGEWLVGLAAMAMMALSVYAQRSYRDRRFRRRLHRKERHRHAGTRLRSRRRDQPQFRYQLQ